MKSQIYSLLFCIALALSFHSCVDDDNHVPGDLQINDFVWKGMNLYYLWQQDVPELDDERFANQDELNNFLRGYTDPTALFNDLRVDASIDRFSVIYNDYRVLEGILAGTTKNNGVDFELRFKPGSNTELFGWVRYILPNSAASAEDIQRGDVFYAINGEQLTINNYRNLLANETYTLNLAEYNNGAITPTGESVTLTKSVISENPVLVTNVIDAGVNKIGYLMYNGFYPNYDDELNAAFGQLKAQNITDLVLDLRYNSGGSIATSARLASMVTGQFTGQLFAREQWNEKLQPYFESSNPGGIRNNFTSSIGGAPINSLNLSRVYVLTTQSTASASELVINGLEPYIEVIQIGTNTIGKNVGSITLYDSPSFDKDDLNPNHFYAMQPIVLKVVNKAGFGDYQQTGLVPDHPLAEDLDELGMLGDQSEPLLSTAIGLITANGRMLKRNMKAVEIRFIDVKALDHRDQMYSTRGK